MSKAVQGRREERQQRANQRRRQRIKVGAVAALGGAVILGTAGAGAGSDKDLRATAGIQLASMTLPIFNETGAEAAQTAEEPPSSASASPSATGEAPAAPTAAAAETTPEAAEGTPDAAAEAAATKAAAEQAAAQAAAEQAAAAAAEEAAAAEAARIAAASVPVNDPAAAKSYAATALGGHGWGPDQMTCLDTLWQKESEWLTSATNASSGAYGIPQALPGTKLATAGGDWQTSYKTQINWGLTYIESRYGSPCSALNFHYANNWY